MLFDTHAHYDDERFDGDREALLAGMPEKNVGLIVNPGCDISSSQTAVALAESFDFVYAAVGIHPENCGDFEPGMIDRLRRKIPGWWPSGRSAWTTTGRKIRPGSCSRRCCGGSFGWRRSLAYP